jgi:hypothetical protein
MATRGADKSAILEAMVAGVSNRVAAPNKVVDNEPATSQCRHHRFSAGRQPPPAAMAFRQDRGTPPRQGQACACCVRENQGRHLQTRRPKNMCFADRH